MSIVLMVIVIGSISGALALLWKRKIEEMFGLSVFISITILYVCGLLGFLQAGAWLVTGLAAISAGIVLICLLHHGKASCQRLITPGLLVFGILLVWLFIRYRNALVDNHDDYSHWALEVKNMFQLQAIPNGLPASTTYFTNYPPASALFSYFWCWLSGEMSEGNMLRANVLLMVSMLLPVFSKLEWKDWKKLFPLAGLCFLLPMLFNHDSYTALLIDALISCMAAYPLWFVYHSPDRSSTLPVLCLTCFLLPLVKVSGIGLAGLVLIIFAVDLFAGNKPLPAGKKLLRLALPLLCAIASKLIWEAFMETRIASASAAGGVLASLRTLVQEGLQPYQRQTLSAFFTRLTHSANWNAYSGRCFALWACAYTVVSIALCRLEPSVENRGRMKRFFAATGIGGLLYAGILLVSYFFSFTPGEAVRVAACERYLSTILLFAALVVLYMMSGKLACGSSGKVWLVFVCILLLVNPTHLRANTVDYQQYIVGAQKNRQWNQPSAQVFDALNGETDLVSVIIQSDETVYFWRDRYMFSPVKADAAGSYSIRHSSLQEEPSPYGCMFTTPDEWEAMLRNRGFTHLYIHQYDEAFVEGFGEMFENPSEICNGSLFLIADETEEHVFTFVAQ